MGRAHVLAISGGGTGGSSRAGHRSGRCWYKILVPNKICVERHMEAKQWTATLEHWVCPDHRGWGTRHTPFGRVSKPLPVVAGVQQS